MRYRLNRRSWARPHLRPKAALPLAQGKSATWTVQNPHGLHARPAARLVEALAPFKAELVLEKQGQCVDPRSLNQLALLQVRHGDTIRLIADGAQADEALAAFKALAEQHFGETVSERQQLRCMAFRWRKRHQRAGVPGPLLAANRR